MLAIYCRVDKTGVVDMQIDKIIDSANEVREENFQTAPPIDVYGIAENNGLQIIELPFPPEQSDIAGFVTMSGGKGKLYVNLNDHPNRRRFTIAHELGHWRLHEEELKKNPERSILFRIAIGKLNKDPVEKEANIFAANLLVPLGLLEKELDGKDNQELAKLFGVSTDVIGYRLKLIERKPDVQEKASSN
jgi:Zn-dependent peptidase ImmA (M78 family)